MSLDRKYMAIGKMNNKRAMWLVIGAVFILFSCRLAGSALESDTPSWIEGFKKYEKNPIMKPSGQGFDASLAFNPAAILVGDTVYLLYRAVNLSEHYEGVGTRSTIGLAESRDGINFVRKSTPVIVPEHDYELPGGCEDPRIVRIGDTFYLTYTGYSLKGTPSCLASSNDLYRWKKHGPIVPAKSAAILSTPINGKYWLYYGDTSIWAAYSTDFQNWTVVEKPVLEPRAGYFDEGLVEPGPPPVMTERGILLIYNGNLPESRARELGKKEGREMTRRYATGWAIFSAEDPTKLIARSAVPFLTPTENFEKVGQISDVVFSEGLVEKDGKVYLYYGGADTSIGVAVSDIPWKRPLSVPVFSGVRKFLSPILTPRGEGFEKDRVYNPTVIQEGNILQMIYRAEGKGTGTGSFGLARSSDGVNFVRHGRIMKVEENFEKGGCEDPRIVRFGDTFYLFYVGNEGDTPGNICLASSKNLLEWKKHGEILQPAADWERRQIKAPAPVPQKINGKYWMYYQGEKEAWKARIGLAWSEDLIHWTQLPAPVMTPRQGYFDSEGTEPGVAVVIDEGILLIYNGWGGDGTNRNVAGWALFSKDDPAKLIKRCKVPFISFPNDHIFATGLAEFKGKWFLYYGAADEWIDGMTIDFKQLLKD